MTNAQVTQLLIGIARAQRALARALTRDDAAAVKQVIGNLQSEAGASRKDVHPTLLDLPSRILLQLFGAELTGRKPDLDAWIRQELSRLLV